jgi:prevent-host-death family protein
MSKTLLGKSVPGGKRQEFCTIVLYAIGWAMALVSVSDLRQHLPAFLKRVQAGEELQVTSRGRIIARIAPERDPADEARQWLLDLRDRVSLGDVVQRIPDVEWIGDANHL